MHKFTPEHSQRLESEERYKLLPPEGTLRNAGLKQGMTFVDLGAGTGYFTRAAAEIVGRKGRVFAVEMSQEMIGILKQRGIGENVTIVPSQEYEIPIEDSLADLTLLAFVTHENADIRRFVGEAARVTKNEGKILFLEWKKQSEELGPPIEERLSQAELKRALRDYAILGEGSLTRSHYYVVIEARKPTTQP
jgi:ubiquinone/menaquinone biosynthesis C-methylase UbiE